MENKLSNNTIGVITALTAVFLFSSKAILIKLVYKYNVDTVNLLLLRMVFALPFYTAVLFFKKQKEQKKIPLKFWPLLIGLGMIGYYVASFFDFYGLKYLSASLERIILFVYPTLVVIIGAVVLKTKITRVQLIAILITYIGVLITFGSELQVNDSPNLYLGAGLIFMGALTYACYLVGSGWMIPQIGVQRFTSLAMIVACFSVIIHYLLVGKTSVFHYPLEIYIYALTMGIFCTVLPSYMVSYAIQKLGASKFSIIGSIGPVFTILLAVIFLGESITWVQMIGVAIVIVGVAVVSKK